MTEVPTSDPLVRRVRALFAKAEATPFPAEAEAFLAKAHELMARHAIDAAMLRRAGQTIDEVVSRRVTVRRPYATPRFHLLSGVARSHHCRAILSEPLADGRSCYVVGHASDVDHVLALFAALELQATRALLLEPERDAPRRFRHAFLLAFADRISQRLVAASSAGRAEAERLRGRSVALALRDRSDEVDRAVVQRFPLLRRSRPSASSGAGFSSGRAAADRAALGHQPLSSRRALPPSGGR